jgi:hypothetical protein
MDYYMRLLSTLVSCRYGVRFQHPRLRRPLASGQSWRASLLCDEVPANWEQSLPHPVRALANDRDLAAKQLPTRRESAEPLFYCIHIDSLTRPSRRARTGEVIDRIPCRRPHRGRRAGLCRGTRRAILIRACTIRDLRRLTILQ